MFFKVCCKGPDWSKNFISQVFGLPFSQAINLIAILFLIIPFLATADIKRAEQVTAEDRSNISLGRAVKSLEENTPAGPHNLSPKKLPFTNCRYTSKPLFIETGKCGGFCSGQAICHFKAFSGFYAESRISVFCKATHRKEFPAAGDCPSAIDCYKQSKPDNVLFVGTPSEHWTHEQKKSKLEHENRKWPLKRRDTNDSGAVGGSGAVQ